MLKVLLKKQMFEMFRSFFYNQKSGKMRSAASSAMFIIFYAILLVCIIGGMFFGLAFSMCGSLCAAGMDWLYFSIFGLIAVAFGVFGSVFNTFQGLYMAKDNDLLLSMPIPVSVIMFSRLLGVYIMGFMFSGIILIPVAAVYLIVTPFTVLKLLSNILFILSVSIIILVISCALGYVVAKISNKLKNKSIITVFIALIAFGLYYYIYFKANEVIGYLVANAASIGAKIKGSAYILYAFGNSAAGNILNLAEVITVSVLAFLLTYYLIKRSFLKIATSTPKTEKVEFKGNISLKKSGVKKALFEKEWKRFLSSPNYILNCALGTVFILAAAVMLIVKGNEFSTVLSSIFNYKNGNDYAAGLIMGILCLLASLNDITAPSISLEGKNIYILQSLPINLFLSLKAKVKVHILVTGIPILLCSVISLILLKPTVFLGISLIVLPQLFVLFTALFGLTVNLKRPNLNWTNEIVPIKQNLGVVIVMFSNMIIGALFIVGLFLLGSFININLYVALFTAVMLIVNILIFNWLKVKGTKIFASL